MDRKSGIIENQPVNDNDKEVHKKISSIVIEI